VVAGAGSAGLTRCGARLLPADCTFHLMIGSVFKRTPSAG